MRAIVQMIDELDETTLARCRHGDARAFGQLVERYQDRVYGLCVALLGPSDGEDAAQETFVRVHGAIAAFEPHGSAQLSTWILTIARRLCTDRVRRRRPTAPIDGVPLLDEAPASDARLEAAELQAALMRALAALPDEQRAVVVLQTWSGLDYEQIAAVERIPIGTVRSRLARAKTALRAALLPQERKRHGREG